MAELHLFTANNATIKSAFDMALYDIAAKAAEQPLYRFLGGKSIKSLPTDLTIGIGPVNKMAEQAKRFVADGIRIIKVKLGKNAEEDIARIRSIRQAV
ncbi:MAG: dipeptide epimerase, partial [Flavihumibacter sp.]